MNKPCRIRLNTISYCKRYCPLDFRIWFDEIWYNTLFLKICIWCGNHGSEISFARKYFNVCHLWVISMLTFIHTVLAELTGRGCCVVLCCVCCSYDSQLLCVCVCVIEGESVCVILSCLHQSSTSRCLWCWSLLDMLLTRSHTPLRSICGSVV